MKMTITEIRSYDNLTTLLGRVMVMIFANFTLTAQSQGFVMIRPGA